MEVQRKLERDDIEVVNNLGNKRVKREIDLCLQNHLTKGHVATRGEVRSLSPNSSVSQVPQPKLARNKIQLPVGETRDPALVDILLVRVRRQGSTS